MIRAKQTGYATLGEHIAWDINQTEPRGKFLKRLIGFYSEHNFFVNTKDKIFPKWQKLAHDLHTDEVSLFCHSC